VMVLQRQPMIVSQHSNTKPPLQAATAAAESAASHPPIQSYVQHPPGLAPHRTAAC
jgi:hypothetical protein